MRVLTPLLTPLALAAIVAGCASNPQATADVSCRAIGASLAALAPFRADMPDAAEDRVQRFRERSEPLCAPGTPAPTDAATVGALAAMAFELVTLEKETVR
jgi:hypothetical protein